MEESRGVYGVLEGKPDGERPFGRPMRQREDKIKMGLQEVEWGHELDCSDSGYGHFVGIFNAVMNIRFS
jgi:hypothetical protein